MDQIESRLSAAKAAATASQNDTDIAPRTARMRASLKEATKRLAAAKKKAREYHLSICELLVERAWALLPAHTACLRRVTPAR